MPNDDAMQIELVLPCTDLDAMTAFFVDELGLRIDTVSPADDPVDVALVGLGSRIRLRRAEDARPGRLIVRSAHIASGSPPEERVAPDGTVVEFVSSSDDVVVPAGVPSLSIVRASDAFAPGRAGMGYRDLLPDRWGGRFIASHIRIPDEGAVADYVHFHRIRFQMIFVAAGWVDVVYEDQGPSFRLHAGDCVLQPPQIRHRVLRSSAGLEVIEIGCPAVHATVADHEIGLPTPNVRPERDFDGQRFVRHRAADAPSCDWLVPGLSYRDTGIGEATEGLAGAGVVSAVNSFSGSAPWLHHNGESAMYVVLAGRAEFATSDVTKVLGRGDAVAIPAGMPWQWRNWSDDFELLEVELPAGAVGEQARSQTEVD